MRVFESSSPVARVVASMVHASVRHDPIRAAFHASFIATRLIGGAAAIIALPVYLAVWGAPNVLTVACFAWLAAPLAIAFYLSRTGNLGISHVMSATTLSGLVIFVAAWTGGTGSAFLPWLVAVPVEAALSGSGMVVLAATAIAALGLGGLTAADATGFLPAALSLPFPVWALVSFGTLPALLYAGALAVRGSVLARGLAETQRDQGDHLRDLVDASSDAILTLRRNGNVTFAAGATQGLFDAPGKMLCGDGLFARIHVADRPDYLKALDEAVAGAETSTELRVRRGEMGSAPDYLWVEMRCRQKPTAVGPCSDIIALISEISERKQVEDNLREAHDEADRANIAKGRFLASMSHELRTPLNAIIGFSEILGGESSGSSEQLRRDPEKQREYAKLIHESGNHLLEVVNDVLDMSKIETGNFELFPESFDIGALIESSCRMVEGQADKAGLRLETDLPHAMSEIYADRRACRQIILNLLSNAVKFSKPGGRIVAGAYRDTSGAAIYVADEGVGIPRTDIPRLGAPFVQLGSSYDPDHRGTGLGLSVVKGLVSLHGGIMEIDSELGVGTRVTISLPKEASLPVGDVSVGNGAIAGIDNHTQADPVRLSA